MASKEKRIEPGEMRQIIEIPAYNTIDEDSVSGLMLQLAPRPSWDNPDCPEITLIYIDSGGKCTSVMIHKHLLLAAINDICKTLD